jgi:hypothetical protein
MSHVGLILLTMAYAGTLEPERTPADADVLRSAEAAFRAGSDQRADGTKARALFEQAAKDLALLQERGYRNAGLSLQLGNARLLAGHLADAILAYNQGLDLAPNDRALLDALDYARQQVVFPGGKFARPPVDDLPPWLPRPGPTTLFLLALLAFTIGCLAIARQRMTRTSGWLLLAITSLLIAVALTMTLIAQQQALAKRTQLVVIAQDGVLLRRGDGLAFPPRYETTLPCGAETRLRRARGDWLQIELTGGEIGWVPRELTRME